jgi:hypothetical protein
MNDDKLLYAVADMVSDAELMTSTSTARQIIQLVRDSEWISVETETPFEEHHCGGDKYYSDMVLTWHRDGFHGIGRWVEGESPDVLITHWQPLPSPPSTKAAK